MSWGDRVVSVYARPYIGPLWLLKGREGRSRLSGNIIIIIIIPVILPVILFIHLTSQ